MNKLKITIFNSKKSFHHQTFPYFGYAILCSPSNLCCEFRLSFFFFIWKPNSTRLLNVSSIFALFSCICCIFRWDLLDSLLGTWHTSACHSRRRGCTRGGGKGGRRGYTWCGVKSRIRIELLISYQSGYSHRNVTTDNHQIFHILVLNYRSCIISIFFLSAYIYKYIFW